LILNLDDGIVSSTWKRGKNITMNETGAWRILGHRLGVVTEFAAFRLEGRWHSPRTSIPTGWMASRSFVEK
jgi:hypothetical protein